MIVEDISKNLKTGIIQLIYSGEYPSEEEIITEVQKYFNNQNLEIIDIESEGTEGRVFLK